MPQPAELAGHLADRSTSLQHRDEAGLLGVGARLARLFPRGRPARLLASAIDGGAQGAQNVVGPGLARPVEFGPQPILGGLAGGEQLLLRADVRLALGRFGLRGSILAGLKKTRGLRITSDKHAGGERIYRLAAPAESSRNAD